MNAHTRISLILCLAALTSVSFTVACGDDFAQVEEGDVVVSPDQISIPQTSVDRTYNAQFSIRNNGDGELLLENIQIVNASPYIQFSSAFMTAMARDNDWRQAVGGQSWDEHPSMTMRPSGEIQVDIVFSPVDLDPQCPIADDDSCGQIVITTNDRNTPSLTIDLNLAQGGGQIEVDPTVLLFPDIVGGPYAEEFTITNVGTGPLTIQGVIDPSVEGIRLANNDSRQEPFNLASGETSTYTVTFTPDAGTEYDCTDGECDLGFVIVESNDARGVNVAIALSTGGATNPDFTIDRSRIEFEAAVGSPDTETFEIGNDGGGNLININMRLDPDLLSSGAFTYTIGETVIAAADAPTGVPISSLAPASTQAVQLTYDPADEATIRGTITITHSDQDESPFILDIFAGTPAPELDFDPTQLYFQDVALGGSATQSFSIINTGRSMLTILDAQTALSIEFTIPDINGATIPAGGRMPVAVTYTRPADDLGAIDNAEIRVVSDALINNNARFNVFAYHDDQALPPTAVIAVEPAEPYTVGQTINLDGTGSAPPDLGGDEDPGSLRYRWSLLGAPAGTEAGFTSISNSNTNFVPDIAGTYTVLLTVTYPISETVTVQAQETRNLLVTE